MSLFCNKPTSDHRDLHSFPTRRSSDLPDAEGTRREHRQVGRATPEAEPRVGGRAEDPPGRPGQAVREGRRPHPEARRREDRKSTRLNSSHVEISYAVFCLKKKKKKSRR